MADAEEVQTEFDFTDVKKYDISYKAVAGANIKSEDEYKEKYKKSIEDPKGFWGEVTKSHWKFQFNQKCVFELATSHIDWFRPFDDVMSG